MYKIVVAGGGAAGMSVASLLTRLGVAKPSEIAVVEPSREHDYQPGYTLIGGGLLGSNEDFLRNKIHNIRRKTTSLFNPKLNFYNQKVTSFSPERNTISIETGDLQYETLIVSMGCQINTEGIPGLHEALEDPKSPVGTIYKFDYALKTNDLIRNFRGGEAVFCQPNQPIKCAGAPQKIIYLAHDAWSANGVANRTNINFYLPQPGIFGVQKFAKSLAQIAESRGVNMNNGHLLKSVNKEAKQAVFSRGEEDITVNYDFLHVCPPHKPHEVLKPLADQSGFVEVDKQTMRHNRFPNVWALGDCSNLPTSKTAAAAFVQAPILVENVKKVLNGDSELYQYDGYTSCPLFVGNDKLLLAEFKYGAVPDETFFNNQDVPRSAFFYMTRYAFHNVYFNLVPRGWWFGRSTIFKPNYKTAAH